MGSQFGYKKYMKKNVQKDNTILKTFILSFFGMLLVFTFLIKSYSPNVDVSIGDYSNEASVEDVEKNDVDRRLSMIQDEDRERNFSDVMSEANTKNSDSMDYSVREKNDYTEQNTETKNQESITLEPVYKVYVGNYSSTEQAKVAKEIMIENSNGFNPIVKCVGSNNYTLQLGSFKSKSSAEALLSKVQQAHLPGRLVTEY